MKNKQTLVSALYCIHLCFCLFISLSRILSWKKVELEWILTLEFDF